jgi:glutamate-ammonia-ligase adenylyltransferase
MPTDVIELARLGRSLGLGPDPALELTNTWRRHAREVRRIHEKLFYRPLLDAVARLSSEDARLTPDAARARLSVLGFSDPQGALRHLEALTSGVSRRAVIQRTLLPVMLDWFASSPDPDAAILGFRRVSESLGATPWYLRLLRDESVTAARLATILGTSRYATDLLLRAPEAVRHLAEDLQPRDREELINEARSLVSRHENRADAVAALRAMRRRELFRLACASVLDEVSVADVATGISDITDSVIEGALGLLRAVDDPPFVVVAMGRYGGGELGFGSDADVMFCYDEQTDTSGERAHVIAGELRALLMSPSPDPELVIDADLRPEGKNGPLVRSLESFRAYYSRWSSGWESQALLRAEIAAGDVELGKAFIELINPIRYNEQGLTPSALLEIRRLKARMESERLPRGIEPQLHFKLGPGGLSDVEWVVQILQMQYGHIYESLRTTRTLSALRAAKDAALMSDSDEAALEASWVLATRVRNAVMLVRGRASETLPTDSLQLAQVAQALGYGARAGQLLREDYLRTTRRSRAVVMRLLYGQTD